MKFWNFIFTLFCFPISAVVVAGQTSPPAVAQCRIRCTVSSVVEWSDAFFQEIDLGELNIKNKTAAGETSLTLYTNGDVIITADNSPSAKLSYGSYALQTEYQLKCDGTGLGQTGAKPTQWCTYDTFLKEPAEIIHNPADGAVVVILSVKASVADIHKDNTGEYNAIQTLTACWKS
ncbi:MAG: hypothetical protein A2Y10_13250 [Planctomycetes bacterium GWF2_41_51]|nr:MAG: hypothetical protein A2Y10_13250 [Planctomycetes bacterium GWF2_41_51]HBG27326.1 hypothetical protein [Phycisphaerales bacterium]